MTHTKGPYTVSKGGSIYGGIAYITSSEGKSLALILDDASISDAELFAAAPEMLELLRRLWNTLDDNHSEGGDAHEAYNILKGSYDNGLGKLLRENNND